MTSSDKRIKVTDRRMFTPEGELREEYKDALDGATQVAEPAIGTQAPSPAPPRPAEPVPPRPAEPEPDRPSGAKLEDLVALLAQSASVYLSQAAQRIETRSEHLEMARMHVDLLAILKHKTRGNLKAEESAMLEQVLAQLRMAFVQNG